MAMNILGSLTPQQFMQEYWQKKPLLIRQAIPNFKSPISPDELCLLATNDYVESRYIRRHHGNWELNYGPLGDLPDFSVPNWTILIQNLEAHYDDIAQLMQKFRFVGDVRLDDIMASVASDGGGVGPHFDSYDVFLLQAYGQRHWRISQQDDLSLKPGLPLKILENFQPEQDYVLVPGDMLYLPPHIAHDGIAQGICVTLSIGFRAPSLATLARGLLDTAGDHLMARIGDFSGLYSENPLDGPVLDSHYSDPNAPATNTPAQIPQALIDTALKAVKTIEFNPALAARFLGHWLSEPSASAYFEESNSPLTIDLEEALPETGRLELHRGTRMLYTDTELFINGELAPLAPSSALKKLADQRYLNCTAELGQQLNASERQLLALWMDEAWLLYKPTPRKA